VSFCELGTLREWGHVRTLDNCSDSGSELTEWNQTNTNIFLDQRPLLMPSLARYIRGIRAVGIKEWWHQLQYIGDVKVGTFVGSDQCVPCFHPEVHV